jgi:cellobiose phosphorylase
MLTLKKKMRHDKDKNGLPAWRRFAHEAPLHSDLFTTEELGQHAASLAGSHHTDRHQYPNHLRRRLRDNENALDAAYDFVAAASSHEPRLPPAADWLLDNFHVIEEQINAARHHLPQGYSRELPRLIGGELKGYPRVYAIASELISHIDGRIDSDTLSKFVIAYQKHSLLSLGELWAIPIMLRLALIENLRRLSLRVVIALEQSRSGSAWIGRMIAESRSRSTDLVLIVADLARSNLDITSAFVAGFMHRSQDQSATLGMATGWLEQHLNEKHSSIELMLQSENQEQAADQVLIGNSINSLKALSSIDWKEFVESHSAVEACLRCDPAGIYQFMDFATRDNYRHIVEEIAKHSRFTEQEISLQAVALAKAQPPHDERKSHVGYFLIDHGRRILESELDVRRTLPRLLDQAFRAMPLGWYALGIASVMVPLTGAGVWWSGALAWSPWEIVVLALVLILAVSQCSINCANWLFLIFIRPHALPRLDFSRGIPENFCTMIAFPAMIRTKEDIPGLLEQLEVCYLANSDDRLTFALLTDFCDADACDMPGDNEAISSARDGIARLNSKYEHVHRNAFHLFHRSRCWNPLQGVWMGHERKRGKLAALNGYLLRNERVAFSTIVSDASSLAPVHYIITLDTDTVLPRDAARKLVGSIAHPLNRAFLDGAGNLVHGYAILQPRTAISVTSSNRSHFSSLCASDPGVDPYSRVVSDVYQDLFGEGSFVGKGIYEIAACDRILHQRFPDNSILSHDLIEGCFARSGLVSDVTVFESQPSRYLVDISRRHRWVRGDWQLLPWLFSWVKDGSGLRTRNTLSYLSQLKLIDNLRRSLVPITLLMVLIGGWTILPGPIGFWVAVFGLLFVAPIALSGLYLLVRKAIDVSMMMHLRKQGITIANDIGQMALSIIFLPFEAIRLCDAILRTLGRLWITHRNALEWQTASDAELSGSTSLSSVIAAMWVAPTISIALACYILTCSEPGQALTAMPLLCIWSVSPLIAWSLSKTLCDTQPPLTADQRQVLGDLSRRTWRFFENYLSEGDNWLIPDNIQQYPTNMTAHRTSPTNIGLSLLANLAANDFGYISPLRLLDRTEKTISTMERMERYRGHFFNWYDTQTAYPMSPRYISTVDSGNLAFFLLILRSGLLELIDTSLCPKIYYGGIASTVSCLISAATDLHHLNQHPPGFDERLRQICDLLAAVDLAKPGLSARFGALNEAVKATAALASATASSDNLELRWWTNALSSECVDHRDMLRQAAPWCVVGPPPPCLWTLAIGDEHTPDNLDRLHSALRRLDTVVTMSDNARSSIDLESIIDAVLTEYGTMNTYQAVECMNWVRTLRAALAQVAINTEAMIARIHRLARCCDRQADIDWSFLYDAHRKLFVIGFNVLEGRADRSCYDLLASEARMASFLAISQGKVGEEHWFALGRLLTSSNSDTALLSWSGSMFEYLMPLLVMPTYKNTLLDQSYKAVIRQQASYGSLRGVPWGISESGYNLLNSHYHYQYRAFGVPGMGLKRGLDEDLVVAPYATVMALMVDQPRSFDNLQRLREIMGEGQFGLYEAIDYTSSRIPRGQTSVTIHSFMAHHQGMSLLALAYVMLDRPMQRRFEAEPRFRATELLLQERVPMTTRIIHPHTSEVGISRRAAVEKDNPLRIVTNPGTHKPEVQLLSNGRYQVMISDSGGGSSRWMDNACNRWREDGTRDCYGWFCYIRDIDRDVFWSTTHQPTLKIGQSYEAIFSPSRAEFRRQDHDIISHTENAVSPEDDVEIRRTTITNRSRRVRTIEITSYGEVVIAPQASEIAHPAFSNLFVQTAIDHEIGSLLCTRRPRRASDQPPWLVHLMVVDGHEIGHASFETDRSQFIGRGRTAVNPMAMIGRGPLSNTAGAVLDPVIAIRRTLLLQPEETATVTLVYCVADTSARAKGLASKYRDPRLAERLFGLAWTHSQVLLTQLDASEADSQIFGRLASTLVYPNAMRRTTPPAPLANHRGQAGLWSYGISGDFPIVLLILSDIANMDIVKKILRAHAYWRLKGLVVDLVIVNGDHSVYRQSVNDQIMGFIAAGINANLVDKPGGFFIRRSDQFTDEDKMLLESMARMVIPDNAGSIEQFAEASFRTAPPIPRLMPIRQYQGTVADESTAARGKLLFANGLGGFTEDGREYVITLDTDHWTPAPWVNVLANPGFGCVISECGSSYTWAENSHEFRLTPWHNDPVCDDSGESLYIRDEESGRFWSPTPLPTRGTQSYVIRHGFGYSIFAYTEGGISSTYTTYVDCELPVRYMRITMRNSSGRVRRLSVTGYVEWVLGELRHKNAMHIVSEIEPRSGALLARNTFNSDFAGRIAFFAVDTSARSHTGDRAEFLGYNGTRANPASLSRSRLSGQVGSGYDPCGALQVYLTLADGQEREIIFCLGAAKGDQQLQQLLTTCIGNTAAHSSLEHVWQYWKQTLGAVTVQTPDPAVNVLANGWLLYQTIACRLWGRSGFYQSGGAYGFRDQLQDTMALLHCAPDLMRAHLLRSAARQYTEGDVQHWWHPPLDRGVRTHFSDDFLWLPYAVCRYVVGSGDYGVLNEQIPFLVGRSVRPEEESYYDQPNHSDLKKPLYDHCVRALENGMRYGSHGLPLIGCGDWNDGMNLVGEHGLGESVWLAFFQHDVMTRFSEIARLRGDTELSNRLNDHASRLATSIERHGWDGSWYRRAYFDDGTPLGSATNQECQIDSLPQSWSVLSGVGSRKRALEALSEVDRRLVRRKSGLIQLFDPPFDLSPLEPGYIKGYVPGVRENGGQYTHAALWTIMAFAELGDGEKAWDLLRMVNPVLKSNSPEKVAIYKVEPYVMAGDVYYCPAHIGRGGWTWYTGSAGWMYRVLLESLLGLERTGDHLKIHALLPRTWNSFTINYRFRGTMYHITVRRTSNGECNQLDGVDLCDGGVALVDDQRDHSVLIFRQDPIA